jgi:glucose-6-phosphate dehydrogenase assembly protein OpcA
MKELIDSFPGLDLPVSEVISRLESMWHSDTLGASSAFRASQMNVVLHFGWKVTQSQARERFDTLLAFAQRYPCRIIVLCPTRSIVDGSMRAKLFSQCYIGDSHREMCCCEALFLGYQPDDCGYLGNQVSVWLEPDLPVYHWLCGVSSNRIEQYFSSLLVGVRRTIYDSSFEEDDLTQLNWPEINRLEDLAKARLLPVRQAIGQYLSSYATEDLRCCLKKVTVQHIDTMRGEGQQLMAWIQGCLGACVSQEKPEKTPIEYRTELITDPKLKESLSLEFKYSDLREFKWRKFRDGSMGDIKASISGEVEKISTRIKPLGADQTIAESLFF